MVRYWPEFGAAGKEHIPVRWLLSHQAGLPVVDGPLTGFGYVPNLWSWNVAEPRAKNLAAAVAACLG